MNISGLNSNMSDFKYMHHQAKLLETRNVTHKNPIFSANSNAVDIIRTLQPTESTDIAKYCMENAIQQVKFTFFNSLPKRELIGKEGLYTEAIRQKAEEILGTSQIGFNVVPYEEYCIGDPMMAGFWADRIGFESYGSNIKFLLAGKGRRGGKGYGHDYDISKVIDYFHFLVENGWLRYTSSNDYKILIDENSYVKELENYGKVFHMTNPIILIGSKKADSSSKNKPILYTPDGSIISIKPNTK